jgi:hypothetical protein
MKAILLAFDDIPSYHSRYIASVVDVLGKKST